MNFYFKFKQEIDMKLFRLQILKDIEKKKILNQIKQNYKYLQYLNNLNTEDDIQLNLININYNLNLGTGTGVSIGERDLFTNTKNNSKVDDINMNTKTTIAYSSFDIPFKIDNISNSIKDIRKGIGLTNKKYLAHNTFEENFKVITYNIKNNDKEYDANVNDDFNSKKFSSEHKNMIRDSISSIWSKLNIASNSTVIVMMVDEKTNNFRYTFFRVYTGKNFICDDDINNIKYTEWRKSNII
jgi:hypothetical protein